MEILIAETLLMKLIVTLKSIHSQLQQRKNPQLKEYQHRGSKLNYLSSIKIRKKPSHILTLKVVVKAVHCREHRICVPLAQVPLFFR